jgi:hypothetical protein
VMKKLEVTFAGCHGERRKERRKEGARGGALEADSGAHVRFMADLPLARLVMELHGVADSRPTTADVVPAL